MRIFWNLNAVHGLVWAAGQAVWTYYDLVHGGVPVISPTDPLFFASSIPLAAALYGRPERDRPRWLFDIVLLDLVLIALFSAFVYIYFVVSIAITDGNEQLYHANLTQLLNARNLALALWSIWVWRTAPSPAWRRMLGIYAAGLSLAFAGGIVLRRHRPERRVRARRALGPVVDAAVRGHGPGRGRGATTRACSSRRKRRRPWRGCRWCR